MANPQMLDAERADVELKALAALKEALKAEWAQDPDFLLELADAETGLMELLDAMVLADHADGELIVGMGRALEVLKERQHRIEQRKERRRGLIERALIMLERDKLERPAGTLTMSRRPRQLVVMNEAEIPSQFFQSKMVVSLDKKALKAALEAEGAIIPGAALDNGTVSLTIRRR